MSQHLKTRSSNMRSGKQTTGRTGQCQPDALQKMRRFAGADFHFRDFFGRRISSDESDLDNRDQAPKFPLAAGVLLSANAEGLYSFISAATCDVTGQAGCFLGRQGRRTERNCVRSIKLAMNLSWSDLNNVREAGDYPFRDGTIVITFAEIAIWKSNPQAIFQLMRKHPVQDEFRYALGKQIEERPAPAEAKLIYESSNGDAWYLTRDAATGARTVMQRPAPQSGGQVSHQVSYIAIEKFLSEGANGPEHRAFRSSMAATARVPTMLIGYDVHPPQGEAYDALIRAIQSLGTWWHHLETIWIVQCAHTPAEVRDRLKPYIGIDDQLLVIDISGDAAGWIGVNESGSKWLTDNI